MPIQKSLRKLKNREISLFSAFLRQKSRYRDQYLEVKMSLSSQGIFLTESLDQPLPTVQLEVCSEMTSSWSNLGFWVIFQLFLSVFAENHVICCVHFTVVIPQMMSSTGLQILKHTLTPLASDKKP